jgi:hypothetical protein
MMPPGPLIVLITGTDAWVEMFLIRIRFCCLRLHEPITYENADVRTNKKITIAPNLKQKTLMLVSTWLQRFLSVHEKKVSFSEYPKPIYHIVAYLLKLITDWS